MNEPLELDALREGETIRVTLADETTLVGVLEDGPDTGPPNTPEGEIAGWDEKTLLAPIEVVERDGTDYETLMLTQERYGDDLSSIEGVAYHYSDGEYYDDTLAIESIEVL